jgi:2-haloacid dehalogenase
MIQAVVFDAYGTLFDVYSVAALADQLYSGQGAAIAAMWRDKQVEYSRLITMSDPHQPGGSRHYVDFWELTRRSLRYTLARLGLEHREEREEALMAQYAQLKAFPENLRVLQTLKAQGMATAILSNGSPQMLESAVRSADLMPLIDRVISVDGIRLFKTAPEAYGLVLQHYPVSPAQVLFVSSNAWDALGATWFGFTTVWINRSGLPGETIGPPPTHVGTGLESVLTVLAQTS